MDPVEAAAHAQRVELVRERREAGLRDPMGWLTLVGLHWLPAGPTTFGADATNDVVVRAESGDVPAFAGAVDVSADRVTLRPLDGIRIDGVEVLQPVPLVDDGGEEEPTVVEIASLRLYLIRRGAGRLALRVKDTAAPALRAFTGLDYFAADPAWLVVGTLESAEPGATIPVPDIVGDLDELPTPGDVVLELGGERHRLHALEAAPGHLWLIFGDDTNGVDTYGGGRFLVTGPVQGDGSVEVDFNLAYNPPCVFSPFATCPLPPSGNRLPMRVEAGERTYAPAAAPHG